jgi:hypothetical protein
MFKNDKVSGTRLLEMNYFQEHASVRNIAAENEFCSRTTICQEHNCLKLLCSRTATSQEHSCLK